MARRSRAFAPFAARGSASGTPDSQAPCQQTSGVAALDLLLAAHAGGDLGDGLEARLADGLVTLDARAVGAVVHPLEGGSEPLDALDQPLAAHQPHLTLLAGLNVVGLVP